MKIKEYFPTLEEAKDFFAKKPKTVIMGITALSVYTFSKLYSWYESIIPSNTIIEFDLTDIDFMFVKIFF